MKEADVSVNIADIHILVNAIEVASQRGAFKANELSTVGNAYDKISRWLTAVMREKQDQADSEGETDA